jgi:hypothetical protein
MCARNGLRIKEEVIHATTSAADECSAVGIGCRSGNPSWIARTRHGQSGAGRSQEGKRTRRRHRQGGAGGEHPTFEIHENENIPTEGVPPKLKLYYEPGQQRLVAAVISVGHETWSTVFRYYFYPNGKLMKTSKSIDGRDDNPPKTAMIFDKNGMVLSKNTDEAPVPAEELVRMFSKLHDMQLCFSAY